MKIKIKKRYIGAIVSLILLFFIFQKMDFQKIWEHLQQFDLKRLLIAIPVYFVGYLLRAKRWKTLMLNLPQLRSMTLMGITLIGYAVNCFMPARAGDFYRAHLAGSTFDISRISVVSSILLERILDGIVVFGFLVFVMIFFFHQPWLYHVAISSGLIFFGVFGFIYWIIKFGNVEDLFRKITILCKKYGLPTRFVNTMRQGTKHIASFINGFEVLNNPKCLANSFLLTIALWTVESIFLFIIINGFGLHFSYAAAVFLLCLTVFSSMVPSLSVHTGPYQCAFILALDAFGVNKEMAIAMAFVTQIIIISFVSISGLFYMFRYHIKLKQIQQEFDEQDSLDEIEVEA
ncbi:MAG: lysylphosphatidylglycerol synthase transmembrane domain-containing protein [Candidatus Gastranaerophilales bacterium]|nr:lysylphosphatidylglycerol synthase transmembrane domain-containing protein [Candidatus Gastranaerophilales bacterium]